MARERERRRISILIFYGTVFLLGYLAYRIVEPFLVEIGWAVVLTICLDPIQARLRPRLGPTRTAFVLTVLVLVLLVLPVAFAGSALLNEGQQVANDLRSQLEDKGGAGAWLHAGWEWVRAKLPFLPPEQEAITRVSAEVGNVAGFMASRAGGLLKGVAAFVFNLVITLGILFFLLRDSDAFAVGLRKLLPFHPEQNELLLHLSRDLVSASVTATLVIAAVQGLVGGVTFAILGIPGAAVWGLIMGILSFLPLVGATLVWLPASVWLVLSGSIGKGIALLLVGILIMGNVDNVVRPLLLSGKTRMNTLVMLLSLLGGVSAFGFIGIVLGPLVAAMITALAETYLRGADVPATAPEEVVVVAPPTPAVAAVIAVRTAVAAPAATPSSSAAAASASPAPAENAKTKGGP
jgi:predicted PurR-regulated permease PerM